MTEDPQNPTSFGEPLVCEPRKPPEAIEAWTWPEGRRIKDFGAIEIVVFSINSMVIYIIWIIYG